MQFDFIPMNEKYVKEIAYTWKYDGIYSFYDMTADEEDLAEFIDPKSWDSILAVLNDSNELIGYFSYYFEDNILWIGFGLKPELTGKGFGYDFVTSGINFLIQHLNYGKNIIMLAVAKFNKRAITLYKKVGFEVIGEYIQETNGGKYEFVRMKKELTSF